METITIQERSELIVSKQSKRTYFTIGDTTGRKFICFKPTIYDKFTLGSDVEVEITAGRNADDTPRIDIPSEAKPAEKPQEQPTRDKIGEGQREGMCWKEIGELIRTEKIITIFGRENAVEITKQYRTYLLGTLKLSFDGAKLPQWKKGD